MSLFHKYFSNIFTSKNQLTGLSVNGTLVKNGLRRSLQNKTMIEWLDFFLNKSVENQKMCIFNKSIQKYEIFKDESIISSNGPLR